MTELKHPAMMYSCRHQNLIFNIELKLVKASGFTWNVRESLKGYTAGSESADRMLMRLKETSGGPLSILEKNLRRVHEVALALEKYPSHDIDISDDDHSSLSEYGEFTIFVNMTPLKTRLQNALEQLQLAQESIFGVLRGDEKDKMEAALSRHCRQTEALIALSNDLSTRHELLPHKPFQIRRVMMVNLLLTCRSVIFTMEEIAEIARMQDADAQLMQDFDIEIANVRKLKAILAKLRDNPSQKISATITECISRTDAIVNAVTEVASRAKALDFEAKNAQRKE